MTPILVGGLVGLLFATGVIIAVRAAPPLRPVRLEDRLAPYLLDTPVQSRLLQRPSATAAPFLVIRRLFGPLGGDLVSMLDRVVGGTASVRRRLAGLGGRMSVEEFRIEQVVWAALGMIGTATLVALLGAAHGGVDPVLTIGAALLGLAGGVFGRDWWLSQQLRRRESRMLAEFPVLADLLALSVIAGEAPVNALQRVCRLTGGELAADLDGALAQARSGLPITKALTELAERSTLEVFARFLEGLVVAIERGTPLADVLRAQAADVREVAKRALLEAGGKKEISMMVPVVFLLLPITVIFALYPGLATLTSLTN
ncbi:tight adherence protein C [Jatrophihabitans sp. GAS493]|uniref:type II secretion system F family protein n=1 Tax=Jatrophihabitans sp. GAS493 TaxID=1907575 RepID=UPI000BB7EFEA|nr:type II secretion system F family protein [Jatrophihabitans sp. GAS493]SOD73065.1 tight adherence protein C [Jatrophihabitans sp. GAS493]